MTHKRDLRPLVYLLVGVELEPERFCHDQDAWRLLVGSRWPPPSETLLSIVPISHLCDSLSNIDSLGCPRPPFIAYGEVSQLPAAVYAGASDFLREPLDAAELRYRVDRVLTGSVGSAAYARSPLEMLFSTLDLTESESRVLQMFVTEAGRTVTRQALSLRLRGTTAVCGRSIDMTICRLRKKLRSLPTGPRIRALRGQGYRMDVER